MLSSWRLITFSLSSNPVMFACTQRCGCMTGWLTAFPPIFMRGAQVANWLPRPGKAKVTYAEGSSFEGVFNGERIKDGHGKYTWMKPAEEDGEDPQVCALLQSTCIVRFLTWHLSSGPIGKMPTT